MVHTGLPVPEWLLLGLGVGVGSAVLVAIVFALGDRLFPSATTGQPRGDGGESRRRAAIRSYLRSLGVSFEEDQPISGRRVAFYLPNRNVAITFDAQAYFALRRDGIHTVLVEHEMPVTHLGRRLPFETPDPESHQSNRPNQRHSTTHHGPDWAFTELGLAPAASTEEVREAYRARVKSAHPDHGGDIDDFRRLREAYVEAKRRAS